MKFEKRQVGQTDLQVSTLGLGGASLAGSLSPVPINDARALIEHALDLGITYLDTAPYYGFGKSEHLVGDGIRPRRDDIVLSTKVGRLLAPQFGPYARPHGWKDPFPFVDVFDYSYDGIMRAHADSLQRLGTNRIDILYVHDIDPLPHHDGDNTRHWKALEQGGYRALEELKAAGTISAFGLGVNGWEILMQAFDLGDWDVFLLAGRYTLLEQDSLSPFMQTCITRNTSVVIGGPFNSGVLVGGSTWDYEEAPPEILEAVKRIETVCADHKVSMPAAALQFPLAHPAVCATIPGPRTIAEMDQIIQWWQQDIPTPFWQDLKNAGCLAKDAPTPGSA